MQAESLDPCSPQEEQPWHTILSASPAALRTSGT